MASSASSCSMTTGCNEKSTASPTNGSDEPPRPTSETPTPKTERVSTPIASASEFPTNQTPASTILGKRKPTRPASDAWQHFVKVGDKAKCKYCDKMYACDSKKNGTSNLNKHISNQCRKYRVGEAKHIASFFEPKKGGPEGGKLTATTCNEEAWRQAIAKMLIIDGLPFRHVEGEGFREMCSLMETRFPVPSPITVARDCLQIYASEKQKLKDFLASNSQRVSLTTDTWTSSQNQNYICLTAHYIDRDWRLQKKILNFCQVANHEGDTIGKAIETCLLEWGIEMVFTVTVGNASSSDLIIAYLSKIVNDWNGTIMRGEFMHVRSSGNIFNLIVVEGLKDYHESVNRIRNVIKYVRDSPLRLQMFKACAHQENISSNRLVFLDDTTRWDSTYLMLETAEKYQKAFESLEGQEAEYVREFCLGEKNRAPSSADWGHARAVVKFLRVLNDATLKFSGSLFVTSNSFLHQLCSIHAQLQSWSESRDAFLKVMAENMMEKYDNYWVHCQTINSYLFVAVLLDPRYKEHHLKYCFSMLCGEDMASELSNKVRITLNELYDEYKLLYPETVPNESVKANKMEAQYDEVDGDMLLTSGYKGLLMDAECETEVDRYLMESCENSDESSFDILGWWKTNSSKYKILAYIARDVLAIPVSTISPDSAFSTSSSGCILDQFRSSLPPRTLEALVCTQNWLRSSVKIDLHAILDGIEEIESDILAASTELAFDDN